MTQQWEWVPHESVDKPDSYETAAWVKEGKSTIVREDDDLAVYYDKYPAVKGHMLFIPKKDTPRYVGLAMSEAYEHGKNEIAKGNCTGFNIGINIGEDAGQSIFWPHVHFIPRQKGDQEPGPKGIRTVYPKDPYHPKNQKKDYHEQQKELQKKRRAYIDKIRKELEDKIGGPWRQ